MSTPQHIDPEAFGKVILDTLAKAAIDTLNERFGVEIPFPPPVPFRFLGVDMKTLQDFAKWGDSQWGKSLGEKPQDTEGEV